MITQRPSFSISSGPDDKLSIDRSARPDRPRPALGDLAASPPGGDPNAMRVDTARRMLRERVKAITRIESVALMEALGRVLADDIIAPINVPLHDNSAMDGYAFDGALLNDLPADEPLILPVVDIALAGHPIERPIAPGACARVMTGALLPPGTDTVIAQEYAMRLTDEGRPDADARAVFGTVTRAASRGAEAFTPHRVALRVAGFRRGANRRLAGEDLCAGAPVLKAGRRLRASDLGLLASLGVANVTVKARLRVAYFSTGDELRSIGEPLTAGGVYDSNRYTLHAMLLGMGVEPLDCGVVRDDPAALGAALRDAASRADAVLTSGGVSAGEADFVREVFSTQGDIVFWKLAMRPGRPFAFGELHCPEAALPDRIVPFFGLPGNPVAVMASFYHVVQDALYVLMGASPEAVPCVSAFTVASIDKRPGRTEFARGIAHRDLHDPSAPWRVRLAGAQGSGVLSSMSEANCFVILEHERPKVHAGETVDIMFFEGLI